MRSDTSALRWRSRGTFGDVLAVKEIIHLEDALPKYAQLLQCAGKEDDVLLLLERALLGRVDARDGTLLHLHHQLAEHGAVAQVVREARAVELDREASFDPLPQRALLGAVEVPLEALQS